MYTVCKKAKKAIFWDALHPTQAGWEYIVNLYANEPGYIHLAAHAHGHGHEHDHAPTLKDWLQVNDNTMEAAGAPKSPRSTYCTLLSPTQSINCILYY